MTHLKSECFIPNAQGKQNYHIDNNCVTMNAYIESLSYTAEMLPGSAAQAKCKPSRLQQRTTWTCRNGRARTSPSVAFAAILGHGSVVTWGSDSSVVQDQLRDVSKLLNRSF